MAAALRERVPARPDSVAHVRRAVGDFAAEVGASGTLVEDVRLAVGEACSNAVLHASAGAGAAIDVEAGVTGRELVVSIRDYGVGMGRRSARRGMGVGLSLIAGLCESIQLRRAHPGTAVEMRFPFAVAEADAQEAAMAASASSRDR